MPWRSSSRKKADATSCDWAHAHCWAPRRSQLCPPRSGRAAASEARSSPSTKRSRKPRLRPAKRAITLRHLLTHTSGLTYSNWSDRIARYEKATGIPDIAESRNGAFAAPLEFDPGERWQYGIGMDVVGKIVEAVSGQSLEIYFRDT